MQSIQRMRAITSRYADLQGLITIPVGVFWIVFTLEQWMQAHGLGDLHGILMLGGMVMVLVLPDRLRRYYRTTFGRVVPSDEPQRHGNEMPFDRVRMAGILIVLIVILFFLIFRDRFMLPVDIGLLGLSIGAAIKGWRSNGLQNHYVALGLGGVVISVLPLPGIISVEDYYRTTDLVGLLIRAVPGLILILGGLFDHLVLNRAMKPNVGEDHG